MVTENLEIARKFAQEVLTARQPELFEEMVAERVEAYFTYTVEDYTNTRAGWKRMLEAVQVILPQHRLHIRNAFALGDRVFMLLRLTAEAEGMDAEDAPEGDGNAIEETLMLRFTDGKIVEAMTLFSRTLGHAEQSGLLPVGWPIAAARE